MGRHKACSKAGISNPTSDAKGFLLESESTLEYSNTAEKSNVSQALYDLDYEKDRIAIVQTLIIFTIWWGGPAEYKDGYYWCSVALTVARTIGLHRDAYNHNLEPCMQHMRRRIWWCCLTRDTITSIGANRFPRTQDSDFSVRSLEYEDFDIQEPASTSTTWSVSRDGTFQKQMAAIFMAMTQLCRIVSQIFNAYDENQIGHSGILYPKESGSPNREHTETLSPTSPNKLEICERELQQWREQVPECALHQSPLPTVTNPQEEALYVHRALLSMLYFLALFCIQRARVIAGQKKSRANTESVQRSKNMMRYAGASTNKIAMELYQIDLVRCLPATGISCILAISFGHVFDLVSPEEEVRREGSHRLEECKLILRELVDPHLAAEWAIKFLNFSASHVIQANDMRRRKRDIDQIRHNGNAASSLSRSEHAAGVKSDTITQNGASIGEPGEAEPSTSLAQVNASTTAYENNSNTANNFLLFPQDELDFSTFPDLWMGMGTTFETFQASNFGSFFDGLQ